MTYIRSPQSFVYLACALNAYSRRMNGWHLARDINTRLTLMALNQAAARFSSKGLIYHSDRGIQYASAAYVACLTEMGVSPSVRKAGCPYDNGRAVRFFKTFRKEEVYVSQYHNFLQYHASVEARASLGYLLPTELEATLTN